MAQNFPSEHTAPDPFPVPFDCESPVPITPLMGLPRFGGDFPPPEPTSEVDKKLSEKISEISAMAPEDLKVHQLPLARVKKIMKSDGDVRMISAEVPALFAQACELFIIELAGKAWKVTKDGERTTMKKGDVATAVARTDMFDFLVDIVPREASR